MFGIVFCIDAIMNCVIQNTKEFFWCKEFWIIGTSIGRVSLGLILAKYLPKNIENILFDGDNI